ncbi:MATE family efflux transporter [Erysipelothrix larvae]|uniref:Probable multidrug resistance protein NorM n=1 Tax=Erysipelothrix larvae TaxID=1514105 RepID=A0A109UH61_9FIRM|nr:MATE family efflux transporter [Erysipelothrix larvae]AMC93748.1 MATE family efflux transporter [Erysipelothrix larvae]
MKNREIDMLKGPLFGGIFAFAIPLALSGILQLLFNAVDIIVVGRFSGETALAAVGSTSALINLLVNLFIGVSVGTNVVMAQYVGAKDYKNANKTVSTSLFTALWGGVIMIFIGFFFSRPLLEMMGTPSNVIDLSTTYMKLYFLGMPGFMIYSFGAALFRSVGDTKRPLYFLSVAGVVHVVVNLLFVIVFKWSVAGVAISTVLSQYISAAFILVSIHTSVDFMRVDVTKLTFHKKQFMMMIRIGLPAGLQGIIFNISNVLIQSSINSFGSIVMAGNTAANNIEGFVYTVMNSFYQASLSFTSQNMGAHKYNRIDKILISCLILVTLAGITFGMGAYVFGSSLVGLYSTNPEVISYGLLRLGIIGTTYFICGIMEVFVGSIRGLGYSIMPMLVSLGGACLFRVIWIFTVFQQAQTLESLYISYPISWVLTTLAHMGCYLVVRKKKLVPSQVLEESPAY